MHPAYEAEILAVHEARFFSKVRKLDGGCWEWIGHRHQKGYGYFKSAGGKVVKAHRVSYEMHNGPIPNGLVICHRCDVPYCVNPDHLFAGSVAENNADRDRKGRHVALRGSEHNMATIDEEVVRGIRSAVASGLKQATVARNFGVSKYIVNAIIKGRTWTHVA